MATTTRAKPPTSPRTRYEDDLYTWVEEQVALLRAGKLSEIDAANIAEELGDVARSEFRSLVSAIAIVMLHLLKWDHQPGRRSRSWELSIREHRARISDDLKDSPGLKGRLTEAMERGYEYGRIRALEESKLADGAIPEACPYSFEEVMKRPVVYQQPKRKRHRTLE